MSTINHALATADEANRKKQESALGMKTPGNPASAPDQAGIAARPKTVDIGGVKHLDLPDQKQPGPLGMIADAAVGTIGYVANAPFNRDSRLEQNRSGLDTSAEVAAEQKRQEASKPPVTATTPKGVQTAANANESDMTGRQGAYMAEKNLSSLEDKGSGIVRTVGRNGIADFTNVGTEAITDPSRKIVVNGYDGAADNESMGKANAIRQQMIDRLPQGGIAILNDPNEAANAEKTARWRQDDLIQQASRGNQAAIAAALGGIAQVNAETIRGQNQLAVEQGRNAVAIRGQDINAQHESARLAGNPVDNLLKQTQAQGIAAQTETTVALADLKKKAATGDAKALATLQAMTGKGVDYKDRYITLPNRKVYNDMGQIVGEEPGGIFDAATGKPVEANGAKQQGPSQADLEFTAKKYGMTVEQVKAKLAQQQAAK